MVNEVIDSFGTDTQASRTEAEALDSCAARP